LRPLDPDVASFQFIDPNGKIICILSMNNRISPLKTDLTDSPGYQIRQSDESQLSGRWLISGTSDMSSGNRTPEQVVLPSTRAGYPIMSEVLVMGCAGLSGIRVATSIPARLKAETVGWHENLSNG